MSTLGGEGEHVQLYTREIARKTNEIARRSDRKDGEKTWSRRGDGANKKYPLELLTIKYRVERSKSSRRYLTAIF